ncbi:unnamed protein product, partial [Prorocentrum cordatum]
GAANSDIRAWYRRVNGGGPPPAAGGTPAYNFAAPLPLADFAALRPAAVRMAADHDTALIAAGVGHAVVPAAAAAGLSAAAGPPVGPPAAPVAAGGAVGLAAALAGPVGLAGPGPAAGPMVPLTPLLTAAAGDDFHTLRVTYDMEGKRHKEFRDAVKEMRQQSWPDWIVPRPCTVLWCANFMRENGGSAVGRHVAFRSACRLGLDDPAMLLHSELSKLLQTAMCYDQLDVSSAASTELICRQLQLCVEKLKDRILGTAGSGHQEHDESWFFTGLQNTSCIMACPALSQWVAEQVAAENAVLKERRKAREERALAKPPPPHRRRGDSGRCPPGFQAAREQFSDVGSGFSI